MKKLQCFNIGKTTREELTSLTSKTPQVLSAFFGDTEVQYLLYDGDEPTIVLVHAVGFNPWQWHPIARELAGRHRVVAPFFCDHRDTDPEKGGLRWTIMAHDLVSLCRHLEVEKPFMVGHSMGGGLCVLAHGDLPNLARKMVLIEPIIFFPHTYDAKIDVSEHPLANRALKRRNRWKDEQEAEAYLRTKSLFSGWDDEMLQIYISHGLSKSDDGGLQLTCSPRGEAALFMGSRARNPWPLLSEISCPVLVLEGEMSDIHAVLDLEQVARELSNGTYQLVPKMGHLMPMEKPKEVLDFIKGFFLGAE